MKKSLLFLSFLLSSMMAQAATITISAFDSGWYTNTGTHDPSNRNTLTTRNLAGNEYRGFLLWNVPDLNGYTVTSARLDVHYASASDSPSYGTLYDISSSNLPYIGLPNGFGKGSTIFADLGSGINYADVAVYSKPWDVWESFNLNNNAVNAIAAASNSPFGIGMRSTSLSDYSSFLFTTSQIYGYENLVLEVQPVPLPSGLLLLLSGLSAFLFKFRRSR